MGQTIVQISVNILNLSVVDTNIMFFLEFYEICVSRKSWVALASMLPLYMI